MTAAMTTAARAALRQVLGQTSADDEHDGQCDGGDHAGQLGAGAGGLGHRRPRRAAGEREALEEPGGDIRRAEREELLVLVDALMELRGVAARENAGVREGDERDSEGGQRQRADVGDGHMSAAHKVGSPCGSGPTTAILSARPRTATNMVAPATAKNTPGNRGAMRRMPRITARQPAPIASVIGSVVVERAHQLLNGLDEALG